MEIIRRCDVEGVYQEMLKTESHHDHKIIVDDQGTIRWKKDEVVDELVTLLDLNMIVGEMLSEGINKNNEMYRRLYRSMGYSLSGYWEVFYWAMNNEDCDEYRQPVV